MARSFPIIKNTDAPFAFFLLCIYIAMVLIRPHEMSNTTNTWSLIKFFSIFSFIVTLFAFKPLKISRQLWCFLALIPLIIFSSLINGSGMWGVTEAQNFIAASIIPLFLISNCTSTIKRQHWLMLISLTAAMCMVHNGHVQQTDPLWNGWALNTHALPKFLTEFRRITYLGFFNDPNDVGMFLVMNIPFVVYFFNRGQAVTKIMMFTILASLIYGVWMTHSRGTALGAGALVGVYYIVVKAGKRIFIAAMAMLPIAITVITKLSNNVDDSANGRLEAWYAGILMLISHPFGIGKGSFADHHGLTAHNSYILVAGELGFIGYSLWGGALLLTVLTSYKFIKNIDVDKLTEEGKDEFNLNKTLYFSLIGFMITGFFLSRSYTVLLFIFIGMSIASHTRLIKIQPELQEQINFKLVKQAIFFSWLIILTVYCALKITL